MVDTHAHLNFQDFTKDWGKVVRESQKQGMEAIINVGAQFDTSRRAIEIAQKSDICFASVGIHPIHTEDVGGLSDKEISSQLFTLAKNKKVAAIGETGLDYYHLPSKHQERTKVKEAQKRLFDIHLVVAQKTKLPVILHCRDAYEDLLQILRSAIERLNNRTMGWGVIHCFCGDLATAQEFLDLGFHIGFTGMITYPGNEYLAEVIRAVPLPKILVETDCPYLPPQVKRGERNEPQNVKYVIQYISQVKDKPFIEIEQITDQNAQILFSLNNV